MLVSGNLIGLGWLLVNCTEINNLPVVFVHTSSNNTSNGNCSLVALRNMDIIRANPFWSSNKNPGWSRCLITSGQLSLGYSSLIVSTKIFTFQEVGGVAVSGVVAGVADGKVVYNWIPSSEDVSVVVCVLDITPRIDATSCSLSLGN